LIDEFGTLHLQERLPETTRVPQSFLLKRLQETIAGVLTVRGNLPPAADAWATASTTAGSNLRPVSSTSRIRSGTTEVVAETS
jgi:hypothetical protein